MSPNDYVHGYSHVESGRLRDQANVLADLLHHDTRYPPGSRVLEAGCGIGAQTVILAGQSSLAHITSVDISLESLARARAAVEAAGLSGVTFQQVHSQHVHRNGEGGEATGVAVGVDRGGSVEPGYSRPRADRPG